MIVIGGYNSSNTCNLARICAERVPDLSHCRPGCLVSADDDPAPADGLARTEALTTGWLPRSGPVTVGLTSGASTPDNLVGAAVEKLAGFCA